MIIVGYWFKQFVFKIHILSPKSGIALRVRYVLIEYISG